MRIFLYYIGKPRDPHANRLAEDYLTRIAKYAKTEMRQIRPDRNNPWSKHPAATRVLLDRTGKRMDSNEFTAFVGRAELASRDLVFLVGGADGFPDGWTDRADLLLSLSPMTYPHELARVLVAEQIYRAFATLRGHPYPR